MCSLVTLAQGRRNPGGKLFRGPEEDIAVELRLDATLPQGGPLPAGRQVAGEVGVVEQPQGVVTEGRVTAEGTFENITGGATSLLVETPHWDRAFTALGRAGIRRSLDGRDLRVTGASPEDITQALGGLDFSLQRVPRTLEEVMGV